MISIHVWNSLHSLSGASLRPDVMWLRYFQVLPVEEPTFHCLVLEPHKGTDVALPLRRKALAGRASG